MFTHLQTMKWASLNMLFPQDHILGILSEFHASFTSRQIKRLPVLGGFAHCKSEVRAVHSWRVQMTMLVPLRELLSWERYTNFRFNGHQYGSLYFSMRTILLMQVCFRGLQNVCIAYRSVFLTL